MHYTMSVNDYTKVWETVKIERGLSDEIETLISKTKEYGARKYQSKADFIQKACIRLLLEEEHGIKEAVAR